MEGKIKLDGVCFADADAIRSFGSLNNLIKEFPGVDPNQLKKAWNDCNKAIQQPIKVKSKPDTNSKRSGE
jgi:hypothetical protein